MSSDLKKPSELKSLVGHEIGVSSWIEVDQQRIDEFAHCTGDTQWIHVDVDRATREGPFKGTIAHGFLTLALVAPSAFEVVVARVSASQAVNAGVEKVRFLSPVRAGKRVRNRIRIAALEDKGGGRYLLTTENTMEIEGEDKPALQAQVIAMLTE